MPKPSGVCARPPRRGDTILAAPIVTHRGVESCDVELDSFLSVCVLSSGWPAALLPRFRRSLAARSLFQPEISIVNTGVLNDVQATVSADMKYVTLNMQAQQSPAGAAEFTFEQTTSASSISSGDDPGDPGPARAKVVRNVPRLPVLSGIRARSIRRGRRRGAGLVLNSRG